MFKTHPCIVARLDTKSGFRPQWASKKGDIKLAGSNEVPLCVGDLMTLKTLEETTRLGAEVLPRTL